VAGRRILVIANETVAGRALCEEIRTRAGARDADVLVVAPALNTRLRHLLADVDAAREAAEGRLEASLHSLEQAGVRARGAVGDSDPIRAIEDALFEFEADEIVISTHPPERSNWLEKKTVERARERFQQPITHVIVDLERERAGG
jgi:GABA permease